MPQIVIATPCDFIGPRLDADGSTRTIAEFLTRRDDPAALRFVETS
jgi:hypothetical protein